MNFIYFSDSNKVNLENSFTDVFCVSESIRIGNGIIYYDDYHAARSLYEDDDYVAYIQGYVKDYNLKGQPDNLHIRSYLDWIYKKGWRLADNYTGSFSIFSVRKSDNEVILANDVIGYNPIYYYLNKPDNYTVISSNIVTIGRAIDGELDEVGVLQQRYSTDNICYGNRTIVEGVKSLMASQFLKINDGDILESLFDTCFYGEISDMSINMESDKMYKVLRDELAISLENELSVNVAMSGGLDSRLVLAAMPENVKLTSHVYGDIETDEVKFAKRCNDILGGEFKNYPVYEYMFPTVDIFKDYVHKTGTVLLNAWIAILENVYRGEEVILLGDMCDSMTGKSIRYYKNGRKDKVKQFLKNTILCKELKLTLSNNLSFEKYKSEKISNLMKSFLKIDFKNNIEKENFYSETISDLNMLFDFLKQINFKYSELYNELFVMITRSRLIMGLQPVINKYKFYPISPVFSIGVLRSSLSIHPKHRLEFKLLDKMFLDHAMSFAKIPTTQIAFVPFSYPRIIKMPLWGFRSIVDQYLIRRLMKKKNPNMRYRLRNTSINWVKVYQYDKMKENVSQWFTVDMLGVKDRVLKNIENRKQLESWPIANMDISLLASLNIQIQLIKRKDAK